MAGSLILDTNVVIELIAGQSAVVEFIQRAPSVAIPSIVLGELFYGAFKSGRTAQNVQRLQEFAAERSILHCDAETSLIYGEIKNRLRLKGRPIPENDLWIAAVAMQHSGTLITRDHHFSEIDGLIFSQPVA